MDIDDNPLEDEVDADLFDQDFDPNLNSEIANALQETSQAQNKVS